jgi:hypothetical protein
MLLVLLVACVQSPEPQTFVTTPVPATAGAQQESAQSPYPGPEQTAGAAYPAPTPDPSASADGRRLTALESYQLAQEEAAQNYDQAARLYAIVPSEIMLGNLGGPPVLPGWFYRFKIPGQQREFIVQVVDGNVTGTTLAESIEEPRPAELPLDVEQIQIDSDDVLERFAEVAAQRDLQTEGVTYDLELVNLEGGDGPVWSVVDPRTRSWIYSVDAVTGEEVPDPRS